MYQWNDRGWYLCDWGRDSDLAIEVLMSCMYLPYDRQLHTPSQWVRYCLHTWFQCCFTKIIIDAIILSDLFNHISWSLISIWLVVTCDTTWNSNWRINQGTGERWITLTRCTSSFVLCQNSTSRVLCAMDRQKSEWTFFLGLKHLGGHFPWQRLTFETFAYKCWHI